MLNITTTKKYDIYVSTLTKNTPIILSSKPYIKLNSSTDHLIRGFLKRVDLQALTPGKIIMFGQAYTVTITYLFGVFPKMIMLQPDLT